MSKQARASDRGVARIGGRGERAGTSGGRPGLSGFSRAVQRAVTLCALSSTPLAFGDSAVRRWKVALPRSIPRSSFFVSRSSRGRSSRSAEVGYVHISVDQLPLAASVSSVLARSIRAVVERTSWFSRGCHGSLRCVQFHLSAHKYRGCTVAWKARAIKLSRVSGDIAPHDAGAGWGGSTTSKEGWRAAAGHSSVSFAVW